MPAELFRWRGPDGSDVLMKWYRIPGGNTGRGGYAEAADAVTNGGAATALAAEIQTTEPRSPESRRRASSASAGTRSAGPSPTS